MRGCLPFGRRGEGDSGVDVFRKGTWRNVDTLRAGRLVDCHFDGPAVGSVWLVSSAGTVEDNSGRKASAGAGVEDVGEEADVREVGMGPATTEPTFRGCGGVLRESSIATGSAGEVVSAIGRPTDESPFR